MKTDRPGVVPREALSSMSTAVLQELLDRELEAKTDADVNVELIMEITTILDARTGNSNIDVDAAYDEFISDYLGYEMLYPADEFDTDEDESVSDTPVRRRKPLGRLGLIAAVLVVLIVGITVTASASGVDLWKAFARWTEETFEFDVAADVPTLAPEKTELFAELRHALTSAGITEQLVPRFISDGYTFKKLETGNGEYRAIYENEDKSLSIQIHPVSAGNATLMEKNNDEPEVYIVNGIEHHIMSNLDLYSVTWVNEGYECTISGIPSIEDAYKMTDSIYWED